MSNDTPNQTAEAWSINRCTFQATCAKVEVFSGYDQKTGLVRTHPSYQLTGITGYLPAPLQERIEAVLSDWNARLEQ